MNDAARKRLIREMQQDLEQHEAETRRLRELLSYLQGEPAVQPLRAAGRRRRGPSSKPTVKTYILKAFSAQPGRTLTVQAIYAGAQASGWKSESVDPQTIIRTNLRRMVEDGTVERVDDGHYRAVVPGPSNGADEN